jgi:serine/threonine-protein kinase SRPK3
VAPVAIIIYQPFIITSSVAQMSSPDQYSDDEGSAASFRFIPAQLGESEDLERYASGGFHPVHIHDEFDDSRYRIVHKLGHGGFSTVWLARDTTSQTWVALKIVVADESARAETKAIFSHSLTSKWQDDGRFVTYQRFFHIEGPNGRHLCLVLPVLGPSAYQVSHYLSSRMRPGIARRVALRTAQYLADLHSQGLCHGGESTCIDQIEDMGLADLFLSQI